MSSFQSIYYLQYFFMPDCFHMVFLWHLFNHRTHKTISVSHKVRVFPSISYFFGVSSFRTDLMWANTSEESFSRRPACFLIRSASRPFSSAFFTLYWNFASFVVLNQYPSFCEKLAEICFIDVWTWNQFTSSNHIISLPLYTSMIIYVV